MSRLSNWKDNLLDASYKDAHFYVERHEFTCGRQTQINELRNPNGPARANIRDSGGKASIYTIHAYLVQNPDNEFDYFHERDELIKVCKEAKSGPLVHPYLGIVDVFVDNEQRVMEDTSEAGVCRLVLRFVENTRKKTSPIISNKPQVIDGVARKAKNTAKDISAKVDIPAIYTSVIGVVNKSIQKVITACSKINNIISTVISDMIGIVSSITTLIETVIRSPCDLMRTIEGVPDQFKNICGLGVDTIKATLKAPCSGVEVVVVEMDGDSIPEVYGTSICENMLDLVADDPMVEIQDVDSRIPESDKNDVALLLEAYNLMLIADFGVIFSRIEFSDREKTISLIMRIDEVFDDFKQRLSELDKSSELIDAVEEIRVAIFQSSEATIQNLGHQVTEVIPEMGITNILNFAYEIFHEDCFEKSKEILSINKDTIRHSGFLPQGMEVFVNHELTQ